MLQARGIAKSFGAVKALRGVDLELDPATVNVLTGDNGSGKSTLLRIFAGLMRPDAGSLTIAGLDALSQPVPARACVGYLGHDSMLDATLSMRENLVFFGRLYGVAKPADRAQTLIARMQAEAFADSPVNELSRGQEQAAGLARALVHAPSLLLLDEPSTGLDAAALERLHRCLGEEAARGACVLFSTHDASLVPAASRVLKLHEGRL